MYKHELCKKKMFVQYTYTKLSLKMAEHSFLDALMLMLGNKCTKIAKKKEHRQAWRQ